MRHVLGVDGGGSGCRAVLMELGDGEVEGSAGEDAAASEGGVGPMAHGTELARAAGGPAVADGRVDGPAVAQVVTVCRAALREAGVEGPVAALWAGLAGAGRAADADGVRRGLERADLARRVWVGTDVEAAFHAAFPEGPGILLVAGTGSVALARGADGSLVRAGGWGPMVGDEGSGYALARAGLGALLRAEDGRGPATSLRAPLLQAMEWLEAEARDEVGPATEVGGDAAAVKGRDACHRVVTWVASADRRRVAALAPVVARVAAEGDAVASALRERAVERLLDHVTALERAGGPWTDAPEVALAGGLLRPGGPLRAPVEAALETTWGEGSVRLRSGSPDATLGAAALARRLALSGPAGEARQE